jgi:hypothetical protein
MPLPGDISCHLEVSKCPTCAQKGQLLLNGNQLFEKFSLNLNK